MDHKPQSSTLHLNTLNASFWRVGYIYHFSGNERSQTDQGWYFLQEQHHCYKVTTILFPPPKQMIIVLGLRILLGIEPIIITISSYPLIFMLWCRILWNNPNFYVILYLEVI